MAFATDRDLVVFEPGVFERAAWVAQRRASGACNVSGTTLTATSSTSDLDQIGLGAGSIVLIDGVAHEVVSVSSATALVISRLRDGAGDAAIGAVSATGVPFAVWTFGPQIEDVHRRLVRMLGLDEPDGPTDADVVNADELAAVEALGALHLIFAGASAAGPLRSAEAEKAEWYRRRFAQERARVVARVDLDGDGAADVVRRPGVVALRRG